MSRGCLLRKEEAICFVVVVEKKQQRTLNIRLGCVASRDGEIELVQFSPEREGKKDINPTLLWLVGRAQVCQCPKMTTGKVFKTK